jgi:hypothetical protein
MSVEFANELWEVLKVHIDYNEQKEAADSLVSFLIDINYDPRDIKTVFSGNKAILTSLSDYLDQHDSEDEYEDYEEDEDDDEWD